MKKIIIASLLGLLLMGSCSPKILSITDAWARPGSMGGNSAIYFVIQNSTGDDDILLSASTEAASTVEFHMSMMDANGMMMMEAQDTVSIPAGSQVVFESGGLHLMLIGLTHDLQTADTISLTLQFQSAGDISLQVPVTEP